MHATPNTQAWATTLLNDCQQLVLTHLRPHVQKMFENSNMAFLEFAEKAQSSASQIQFMEALTVIQKNRSQVEEVFYRELGGAFARFSNRQSRSFLDKAKQDAPLSLLSKEETDIQVAIQNMVQSAAMGAAQELGALRQRLAVLNNGKKIEEQDIPGGPTSLANAFHEAAGTLILEHETKLIVYMLFDKFVLGKLGPLYHEYNERLLKAGLLPNLKYTVRKHPATDAGARSRAGKAASDKAASADGQGGQLQGGEHSLGDELFDNIMGLLARREPGTGGGVTGSSGAGGGPGGQDGDKPAGPLYPQAKIVTAIDTVQHNSPPAAVKAEQVVVIQPGSSEHENIVSEISEGLKAEREQLFTGIDRRRIPAADTQVIDLVGMMFEYLLNDEDIPNVAKAELCRLHTPYLKVGIIDKDFFVDNTHPAHELLNTLSNAAIRWVFEDDLERGIFPAMRNTVQRVITEFTKDVDLFSELLGIFNRSLNELIEKADAIEERTKQAAAGKEKLAVARDIAAEAIESRVSGHHVPSAVRKLLGDIWLDKLMFIYLREPEAENSPSWRLAIRTIEDVIWSAEPRLTEDSQGELRVKLPMLRKRIQQSFEDLDAYGTSDNVAQLKTIAALQEEALNQPVDEQYAAITAAESEPEEVTDTVSLQDDAATAVQQEEEKLSPEARAAIDRLREIAFGTWFFIQENKNDHPVRVKLSWYSKMSGNYMFVDSMGVKSTVWKQTELASMLCDGRARIIGENKEPFVKRALVAIRRILIGD